MSEQQIIKVLRVVSSREGFRRAGRVFGKAARDLPLDTLSDADRAAIEADPMLVATPVDIAVQVEAAAGAGGEVQTPPPPPPPAVVKPAAARTKKSGK